MYETGVVYKRLIYDTAPRSWHTPQMGKELMGKGLYTTPRHVRGTRPR